MLVVFVHLLAGGIKHTQIAEREDQFLGKPDFYFGDWSVNRASDSRGCVVHESMR
jgi:hypothetical protein